MMSFYFYVVYRYILCKQTNMFLSIVLFLMVHNDFSINWLSCSQEEIAVEFSIPSQFQRLWLFCKRQNGTWRPVRPFSTEENNLSMTSLHKLLSRTFLFLNPDGVKLFLEVLNDSSPQNLSNDDGLVFLKLYDPEQTQIRYIGMLFVKASSRPSDILPKLRSLAGFCADEEMELYEEIKFEPSAMCEAIDANITFSESQVPLCCKYLQLRAFLNEKFRSGNLSPSDLSKKKKKNRSVFRASVFTFPCPFKHFLGPFLLADWAWGYHLLPEKLEVFEPPCIPFC
uniref:Ubiquitin carboxyl-terminal hydrolase 7 ICP0-binding domain-containing protein n=1 Tax=Aegilops tauschii subsp. strangulata TaxID=200361 RepID=A0A453CK24_AEGTS